MSKEVIESIKNSASKKLPKVSLNSIIEDFYKIQYELENNGGEVTEELDLALQANKDNFKDKLVGMFYILKQNEAKTEGFYKPEIERLQGIVKRLDTNSKNIKERVLYAVQTFGEVDPKTGTTKVKTDSLNVTAVELTTLFIEEEEFDKVIKNIEWCIKNNDTNEITDDEFDCIDISFNIPKLNIDEAAMFYDALKENLTTEQLEKVGINVNLKSNEAKVKLKERDEIDKTRTDKDKIGFGIKGLSLSSSTYPKFS